MTFAADGAAELWNRWVEERDPQAREELIVYYMPWVKVMAKVVLRNSPRADLEDLVSAGTIGMIEAINRFDPRVGAPFQGYAEQRVKGAMVDSLRTIDWAPTSVRSQARRLGQAVEELSHKLRRSPTDSEIISYLDISSEDLHRWRSRVDRAGLTGLDEAIELGREPVAVGTAPGDELLRTQLLKDLKKDISELAERDQRIMFLYYERGLSMDTIGQMLGITESRVSQLHAAIIGRLRARHVSAA